MADLIESFDNGVLSIVFNRPERKNALSGEMLTMLNAALQRAALDPQVRCVLLSGAEGSFCVGGDVKGFAAGGGAGGGSTRGSGVGAWDSLMKRRRARSMATGTISTPRTSCPRPAR